MAGRRALISYRPLPTSETSNVVGLAEHVYVSIEFGQREPTPDRYKECASVFYHYLVVHFGGNKHHLSLLLEAGS